VNVQQQGQSAHVDPIKRSAKMRVSASSKTPSAQNQHARQEKPHAIQRSLAQTQTLRQSALPRVLQQHHSSVLAIQPLQTNVRIKVATYIAFQSQCHAHLNAGPGQKFSSEITSSQMETSMKPRSRFKVVAKGGQHAHVVPMDWLARLKIHSPSSLRNSAFQRHTMAWQILALYPVAMSKEYVLWRTMMPKASLCQEMRNVS
jgi:hypothetical protein